jgi:hypothetical protein
MQVLLVFNREDPFMITLKNSIVKCGYSVTCCRNIQETHETFKKTNYDLVLIDCRRSPGGSGGGGKSTPSASASSTQVSLSNNQYDYENICRFIRNLYHYTVIVALTPN